MKSLRAEKQYVPQRRVERIIAIGRMVLSAFFLLAIWLDPSEPSHYAQFTYGTLAGYLVYSLILGVLTLRYRLNWNRLHVATHAIDMLVFGFIMFFTDGPTSPFFVYFIFLLVCATFRWQWRGTLWTAAMALVTVLALALCPPNLLHDQNFELNRLIIRIVYLAVVATLLGYLGAHEQSMRNVLDLLSGWPNSIPDDFKSAIREMLKHAALVMDAPRILIVWEEEEPWLYLALWSGGEYQFRREAPAVFETIVAEPLAGISFLCRNAGDNEAEVIQSVDAGLRKWQGPPINSKLQQEFAIGAILGVNLKGEKFSGHLLVLDKKAMTEDDLVLGGIAAREIAARFDHSFLVKQLNHAAASQERIRIARDLHDGLLQSLTGTALQLEARSRKWRNNASKKSNV